MPSSPHSGSRTDKLLAPLLLLLAWSTVTASLSWHHVFWRDEVRALSIATQGHDLVDMFRAVHGEGHPLLWYLMLRAGDGLIGPTALPLIAWLIAFAAAALLALRAPFSLPAKALILASQFALWEYAVMARNYGISMLIMFAFAALYTRWRQAGFRLAWLLVLLTQTNVHSMLIAWLLLGAWLLDTMPPRAQWQRWIARTALPAVTLLALGSLACFFTVWPAANDAAQIKPNLGLSQLATAIVMPGQSFIGGPFSRPLGFGFSFILFAALLALWKRPPLFLAGLGGLLLMSLFFTLIYPGGLRHKALWLVLMLTLVWIRREPIAAAPGTRLPRLFTDARAERIERIGYVALGALLAMQVMMSIFTLADRSKAPDSRAREAARVIAETQGLSGAIVFSDPDYMIEPLPYYARDLRFWRLRQGGFSSVNLFTDRRAHLALTLDDITTTARSLGLCYGRPVAILLAKPPHPGEDRTIASGYDWTTRVTPPMVSRFNAATSLIAQLPPAMSDESYAVYRLRPEAIPAPTPEGKAAACRWLSAFPTAGAPDRKQQVG